MHFFFKIVFKKIRVSFTISRVSQGRPGHHVFLGHQNYYFY